MAKADVFTNRIIGYATKPADQFQANPLNYRKHPQRQRDAVNGSLRELGWIAAVVENVQTGNLIDGHERVWQALKNNEDVPYLQVDLTEDEEKLALAIFDPITNMAETDAAILDELLQDVNTGEAALQELLATLATDAGLYADETPKGEDPGANVSKADELQAKWNVQLGDLWQLGDHRLICGDCTDEATVSRVMGGEKADMVQTDPPYGVDYSGQNTTMFYGKDTKGKERTRIDGDATLVDAIRLIVSALRLLPTPVLFLWHAPQFHNEARQAVSAVNYELFSVICWNKNHANFGAMGARYKPKFEMALACKKSTIPWYGPDNEVTVWDVDRSASNEFHPTQKPPELFGRAIKNHTQPGQIVVDPFSGSGTTIIACEQLGRKCRAVELHPPYIAVALQRWADMTGKTPIKLS